MLSTRSPVRSIHYTGADVNSSSVTGFQKFNWFPNGTLTNLTNGGLQFPLGKSLSSERDSEPVERTDERTGYFARAFIKYACNQLPARAGSRNSSINRRAEYSSTFTSSKTSQLVKSAKTNCRDRVARR